MVATWRSGWYKPHKGRTVIEGTFGTNHLSLDVLGPSTSLSYEYRSRNQAGAWGRWVLVSLGYSASPTFYTSLADGHFRIRANVTSAKLRQTELRISLGISGAAYERESWTVTGP